MINKKTNLFVTPFTVIIVLYTLYSCNERELVTFEKQVIKTNDFLVCNDIDCAIIDVQVLRATNKSDVTAVVNSSIEKHICMTLNMEENKKSNTINEAINGFNKVYQDILEEFPEETIPYEIKIRSELSFQNKKIISVLIDSYAFTGGAHGNKNTTFINFYSKNGQQINNNYLFKDFNKFRDFAEKVFRAKYTILENESINNPGFYFENNKFKLPENIGFTTDSVILYYNQYEISSYADGPIIVKLDKKEVAQFFVIDIL